MGFKNFKIEGRSDHPLVVLEAYMHYMIKPEYQGMARLTFMYSMERAGMLQFNMFPPIPGKPQR